MADLIGSNVLNIIADKDMSEENMTNILKALYIYICRADYEVMLYIVKDQNEEMIAEKAREMSLMSNIAFIDGDNGDQMLSYLLSCDTMITDDIDSVLIPLSAKTYLPRIVVSDRNGLKFEDGILKIKNDPTDICSAFKIIKDKEHRDELSGHRRLVH